MFNTISHVAGFKVTKLERICTVRGQNRTADVCRVTDEFDTTLYAVIVDRQIIHECDDEWSARMWIIKNI